MRIPEHLVEQVRQQSDIVEVIGEAIPLRQRGRNYIGLCPFHGEKTPSFNVSPDRGIYKCFGCGKGGNVFSFLMEYHKMSFVEAIRTLADRVGVALPDEDEDDEEKRDGYSRYDTAYALLRAAANFYYKQLLSPVGKIAADYIRRRGFQEETVKEFGLGYSPDDWQSLINEMQKQGFDEEAFVDTGLAIVRESGNGMYDRFRGRLMFPIQNPMGRVIGFGARLLNNQEKTAKYMNSPQSLVYDKSKVLYGIFQAKDAIRRENVALLVEGYADLLTMYQAGFRNVVASSGTALTREQLQLVGRYSKNLLIVYDGDFAGANAALRGLELSIEEGFDVRVARLPEGEDPDSLIHSRGAQAMERVLGDAVSFVDFKGDAMKAQGLLATPEGQTEVVRSLVETISKVPDHIKRDFMIRAVALRFELNEHLLYTELAQILQKRSLSVRTTLPRRTEPVRDKIEATPGESDTRIQIAKESTPESEKPDETTEYNRLMAELLIEERELIRIMLEEPKSILFMQQKFGVNVDSFVSEVGKQLCGLVFRVAEQYRNIDQVIISRVTGEGNEWEQVYTMILSDIMLRREMPSERWKDFGVSLQEEPLRVIEDCLCRLLIRQKMLEQQAIEVQLKQAAPELELELLRDYSRIRAEIDEIRERGVPRI